MKRNKKYLLALGTLATVVAPVATVVSCGSSEEKVRHFNLLPTYTGQADQLIALGIHSDYYPMQLNVKSPYAYLTNPGQYMTQQSDEFKSKFTESVAGLMPKTQGVSWWNQDAKDSDDSRVSNTYWQKQEGSVLLYEHYLLDDGQKVVTSSWAPKHHSQTAIQTNFRASRDPYTRIPKGVFFGWDLSNKTLEDIATNGELDGTLLLEDEKTHNENVYSKTEGGLADSTTNPAFTIDATSKAVTSTLNGENVVITKDSAKIIIAMRQKRAEFLSATGDDEGQSTWFYNDWFFVDSFHRTYLDNKDFQDSSFKAWMLDSTTTNPFETIARDGQADTLAQDQKALKQLFDASTFQTDEIKNGLPHTSTASAHHPIYEQQEGNIGAAPMFEGAMRDNQLYLFNVAWQVSNLANTGTPYGAQFYSELPQSNPTGSSTAADFSVARSKDEADKIKAYVAKSVTATQLTEMKNALKNANTITSQLKARMGKIKTYLSDLGVAGKTFGLMTIAPGKGVSTLQTNSKYSFIYNELGLSQPVPTNLKELGDNAKAFSDAWKADGTNTNMGANKEGDYVIKPDAPAEIQKAVGSGSLFNMDDNGWFWALGESKGFEGGKGLSEEKLNDFKGQIDFGVLASHDANFKAEISDDSAIEIAVAKMYSTYKGTTAADAKTFVEALRGTNNNADYDLWNEGLKTPFVMDMLLDQIMTKAEEYAVAKDSTVSTVAELQAKFKDSHDAAADWGDYYKTQFGK